MQSSREFDESSVNRRRVPNKDSFLEQHYCVQKLTSFGKDHFSLKQDTNALLLLKSTLNHG